ncbi:hypothetical protein BJV78DRAFT_1225565 [Lactifluus subvellereus]|nr:hypothetical protein BJV78DRAFT_1225565 [Lactifluus subvellereus]
MALSHFISLFLIAVSRPSLLTIFAVPLILPVVNMNARPQGCIRTRAQDARCITHQRAQAEGDGTNGIGGGREKGKGKVGTALLEKGITSHFPPFR